MTDEQTHRALAIRELYRTKNTQDGNRPWGLVDYVAGFNADVGKLTKLIMVKDNLLPDVNDLDKMLKHELGDCLWSIVNLCHELGLSADECFETTLNDLEERLKGVKQ